MVSKKSIPMKKVAHEEHHASEIHKTHKRHGRHILWKFLTVVLAILLVVSIFTHGFRFGKMAVAEASLNNLLNSNIQDDAKTSVKSALASLEKAKELLKNPPAGVKLIVLNDKKCVECQQASAIVDQLKSIFPELQVTNYDYEDAKGKQLYNELALQYLPVFLFDSAVKDAEGYAKIQQYLAPANDYLTLRIGSSFDPKAEICSNSIDDRDNDGLVDCADDECKGQWQCMEKRDTPKVDLFIMSHCPYGTQMEKGMLPVVELLGNKIDFNIRFVYYAMHGEKEVKEQTAQYCIQKEQNEKFLPYLKCFLEAGNSEGCLIKANVDRTMLGVCVKKTDEEFNITANFNDNSKWLSGRYPLFNTDAELNTKYNVGGSPTLVINDVEAAASRDPQSLLDAVCVGFKEKPVECNQLLSSAAYAAGFGFSQTQPANTATGEC